MLREQTRPYDSLVTNFPIYVQEFSNIMWAFARLRHRKMRLSLKIASRLSTRLGHCNPHDIAQFMWAYAELRIKPGTLLNKLPYEIKDRMEQFSPQVGASAGGLALCFMCVPPSGRCFVMG